MEIRQLEIFVAAAEEKNFTRAARRVHIVQSGLSASIRALEAELGAPLFLRTSRRVDLTPAGQVFLVEARRVLAAVRSARQAVLAIEGLERGALSVGAVQSITYFLDLPAALHRFHMEFPGVDLRVRQATVPELLNELLNAHLDLAFLPLANPPPEGISTMLVLREPLGIVCSPQHPLAELDEVPLESLGDQPFVDFPKDWDTRRIVDRTFAAAATHRRTVFEVNDLSMLLELVAEGLGIALMPRPVASPSGVHRASGVVKFIPLPAPVPTWDLFVASGSGGPVDGQPANAAARALLACLLDPSAAKSRRAMAQSVTPGSAARRTRLSR